MEEKTKFRHIPTGDIYEYFQRGDEFQHNIGLSTVPTKIVITGKDWEEVKEKPEYIIMQVQNIFSGKVRNWWGGDNDLPLDYKIYSVKFLVGNIEFKIGDRTNKGVITNIEICKNKDIWIDAKQPEKQYGEVYTLGKVDINKSEKLFTTEDGIPIYKGDIYFYVIRTSTEVDTIRAHNSVEDYQNDTATKRFSTKEAAEKYILWNKKAFSLSDLQSLEKEFPYCLTDKVLQGLSKYVK